MDVSKVKIAFAFEIMYAKCIINNMLETAFTKLQILSFTKLQILYVCTYACVFMYVCVLCMCMNICVVCVIDSRI